MSDEYKANQLIIDSLHQQIKATQAKSDELYIEFRRIEDAAKWMQQLIDLMRKHPIVYEEWTAFLGKAGIEEPFWKAQYEPPCE